MYVISDMMRVSLAQFVLTFLVAALFAVFVGQEAGVSALIGGIAYAFPTALFALYLVTAGRRTSGRFSPYAAGFTKPKFSVSSLKQAPEYPQYTCERSCAVGSRRR